MKKFGFAVAALCVAAGAAQAITLTAHSIETGALVYSSNSAVQYGPRVDTVVYSHIPGPYSAFAAANYLGFDDYTTTVSGPTASLNSLRFVGGVTTANTTLAFDFYDISGSTLVNSFTATFATAGNFIWTISDLGGFDVNSTGLLEIYGTQSTTTGRWFLSASPTTVGTDDRFGITDVSGNTTGLQHSFELSIPAPGSLALLGLGGIVAGRRRR
ncbi:MAG: PEP-CTERM sorting domain-containing protein [Planctomycetota bacterium]|nr:PEP-CTERM sorting domain-containing protein [Planctomycetota bacterium]